MLERNLNPQRLPMTFTFLENQATFDKLWNKKRKKLKNNKSTSICDFYARPYNDGNNNDEMC